MTTGMTEQQEAQALIERWIEPNPHRRGVDEAWIVGYGVPVWALVGHLPAVDGDLDRLARSYALPREAVDAALAYYSRNTAIIDNRLASNAA
ncbi:MAG: DUF433 domain-containing protein [Chloroflexota bacterium]|nr:DUF433 domain-containing protein [Chloroflexota bacterium]